MVVRVLLFILAGWSLHGEALTYSAEWRLMRSGIARLEFFEERARLNLETVGFAASLYKVKNDYQTSFDDSFCSAHILLNANEGKKRRETKVTFQEPPGKSTLVERDLVAGKVADNRTLDVPPCVHDVIAALAKIRTMRVEKGATLRLPIADGKKSVDARIDALSVEQVKTPAGEFKAQRFEAHLFNNVLYRRKGRLFFWLTEDEKRVPVQIRIQLPFYLGTVTLKLDPTP
jgi:hypothetical protein